MKHLKLQGLALASLIGAVLGGIIGQAIGRDSYVKDCMKARGYEKVRPQKKPSQKRRSRDG
jgi:hypothetical protein